MSINSLSLKIACFKALDADELKGLVRDLLVLMNEAERKRFITNMEEEMMRLGLSIKPYLIPLGIAANRVEDLTPNEVGHLIRFIRINVPKAISAIGQVLDTCAVGELTLRSQKIGRNNSGIFF